MLLLLQICLALYFVFVLAQSIVDIFRGGVLILEGLILLVAGYTLKLVALPFRLRRNRIQRCQPVKLHGWRVIPA